MTQELVANVEAFKRGPANLFVQNKPDESLADGIGSSYGVIRYKGKVWSVRHRGVQKNVLRPDDGTPTSYLDVVILSSASVKSKSFYKKYDPSASDGERPICSSINGLVPDDDVVAKQAETCALCPHNAWKPMPNGKKGRECTDYKRLAVMLLPTTTQPLFGEAIMEPFFLRVPPASLNGLAQMGEQMDARGYPYFSYVTRITFDPNEPHPKMVFTGIQPLTDAEAPIILGLRNDPQTNRIVTGDVAVGEMRQVTATVTPEVLLPSMPAPAQVLARAETTSFIGRPSVPPVIQSTVVTQTSIIPPSSVNTGFGTVTPPLATQDTGLPLQSPTPQAVLSDTGVPSEGDEALDNRVLRLLSGNN
jgi:hypothetical protein